MQDRYGIVTAQSCFLYSNTGGVETPPHKSSAAAIEDEIFSGWAVRIFPETEENGLVKIETHYGYKGYVRKDQLALISRETLAERQDKTRFFRIGIRAADVLDRPKVQGLPLEHLLQNAIVELAADMAEERTGQTKAPAEKAQTDEASDMDGWCLVRTAAGHVGYVHEKYLRTRQDDDGYLLQMRPHAMPQTDPTENDAGKMAEPTENGAVGKIADPKEDGAVGYFRKRFLENPPEEESFRRGVVRSARSYLGVQYRWGGKSSLGLDCSGLAFMSYLENGVLIYRDAKLVPDYPVSEIAREQLKPGDLIYFPGHVAVYLGNDCYIHSTGYKETPYVTINSLNPGDKDYRADLAGRITACGSVFPQPSREKFESLRRRLDAMPGNVSAFYKDLITGETFSYRAEEPHIAASVIKMFLMAAVFQGFADGIFAPEDRILIRRGDCVPSCGVLTYLKGERQVSVRDLVELMIIVSDNTAANVLFDLVGEERLADFLRRQPGLQKTVFRRKMFDAGRAAQGIENYVTAADAAWLLEMIYTGKLISREASEEMYRILTHQRLNGKIPFYLHTLPNAPVIAHKTGEDSGVTHDVALVEGKRPFILCFLGNETNVADFERLMAETARDLYLKMQWDKL